MKKILFRSLALLGCGILLTGCVKNISERNVVFNMEQTDLEVLTGQCEEMQKHGDIVELLQEVRSDSQKVLEILETTTSADHQRLHALAERISERSSKIQSLAKSEWTTERWDHEVIWRIDEADFRRSVGHYFRGGFQILDAAVEDVYLMGEKRNDLKEKISVTKSGNLILIKYKALGSSLEICQLEKTLLIATNVRFRNIKKVNNHYFSLYVGF